jgi:hypothetical protein
MMTAIMQPYFFPYIGYFQLMDAVDLFIIYDDAQFMKGGWIHRNRILVGGNAAWWTYPLKHDHYTLSIHQRHYQDAPAVRDRLFAQVANAYRKAPHYRHVAAWLHDIWPGTDNVAAFNAAILAETAQALAIRCKFARASAISSSDARGEERVLQLCEAVGTSTYVNAIGGVDLYHRDHFLRRGIGLEFLVPAVPTYPQFGAAPVPALSILDMLMFRGFNETAAAVREHDFKPHG